MPLYLAPFEQVSSPIGPVFRPVGMEPGGTFMTCGSTPQCRRR